VNHYLKKIYYLSKPLIPRRLQIEVRRMKIRNELVGYSHIWPIDKQAARPPQGWAGWPDGKRFALVLTHDVETAKGQERCLDLVKLEEGLGFRSSFNFVAEAYDVSSDLRQCLTGKGFEVGVHGLDHKGTLYSSRKEFLQHADRINAYLKDWQSVGFRSPSMHHNLEWIHDLNIEYDASTFDTDPFEPQPDGMGTIFPLWVGRDGSPRGYVELPYTLPQDFTLFIILREKNIDIWKRKLDWIAEHGGMALLITHPDYMNLSAGRPGAEEYPAHYYEQLLTYIKTRYVGRYWNPLPKEMARYWSERSLKSTGTTATSSPSESKSIKTRPLRACMLAYSFYDTDNRVRRYAETLAERGAQVDVISLRRDGQTRQGTANGINIHRIQRRIVNEKGKLSYAWRLLLFLIRSFAFLTKEHLKRPFDIVHVHNIPDFEVFAAAVPKLMGAKIILDIHDILPEFYASKFSNGNSSLLYKTLLGVEKISVAFSDHVIISNHLWRDKLVGRSVKEDKCTTILNYPDTNIFFKKSGDGKENNRFIMLYPGTLNWHQGLDIAISAFSKIKDLVPHADFHIYGEGPAKPSLRDLVARLELEERVFIHGSMPIDEIAAVMANADLGIVPKRANSFGNEAFSTKVLEFMALGVPVVVSDTKIDTYYFNESLVKFFKAENDEDLAQCMLTLISDRASRECLSQNALRHIQGLDWGSKKHEYLSLVDRLTNSNVKNAN
jgi:glycosyltransferase involved in cell wall biosynthesis/peptidoglycan/xylan/chitin deacetylase (PgdA/CDA1 family)